MNDKPSNPVTWNLRHPAQLIGTGFGVGLLPKAPGTWGSLAALPFAWLIVDAGGGAALAVAALAAFAAGMWASEVCLKISGDDDPKPVVIDEICGQWLVLVAVPNDVFHYALGFALFRFFDILKPWPVSWADREIKGGLGVMLDDVLAAVYAGALLFGISYGLGI
ncbi:MAG: phosphatidylglycerophosphatase A [Rhodospirillales bacterium]